LPLFPEGSKEREVLINRVKAGCAAQSRQIDKTKIGQNVKELATVCRNFQHIEETDDEATVERKKFLNSILADKKPYFFRYKYTQTDKELKHYLKKREEKLKNKFGNAWNLERLLNTPEEELTDELKEFKRQYYDFLPVVDSDCVMNRISHYIESIDFEIKKRVRSSDAFDYRILQSENFMINKKIYEQIYYTVEEHIKNWQIKRKVTDTKTIQDGNNEKVIAYSALKEALEQICPNDEIVANHMITLFYEDKPSYNKGILWELYGRQIFENLKTKVNSCYFPKKNPNGTLEFLYENYSIEKVDLNKVEVENIDRDLQ